MQPNQLLDAGQVERLLHSFARIVPITLRVEDLDGQVLAEATPVVTPVVTPSVVPEATVPETRRTNQEDVPPRPAFLHAPAPPEARTPIEIHGERSGFVVGLAPDPDGPAAQVVNAVTQLAAQVLADQLYKEHELNSLSTELLDKYEEVTLLYDLSQALGSVFDIPTICDIALEKAVQAVPAAKAFIMLKDEGSGWFPNL